MTMKGFETRKVSLGEIVITESVNVRELDFGLVAEYQTDMEEYGQDDWQAAWAGSGGRLRTVEMDGELHLYGGFHTHRAATAAWGADHEVTVWVNVNPDIPEECRIPSLLAGGENASHGRRRTADEKREAVDRWLRCQYSEDSNKWADRYIAKMVSVSVAYVSKRDGKLREELGEEYTRPDERCYMRNGKVFWSDQTKRNATPEVTETPETPETDEDEQDALTSHLVQNATPEASEASDSETPETPETGEVELTDSLADSAGETDEEDAESGAPEGEDEADADESETDEADEDDGEDADEADELEDSDEADEADEDGDASNEQDDDGGDEDSGEGEVEEDTPQSPMMPNGKPNPQYRVTATAQTANALSNARKSNGSKASMIPFASASLNDVREFNAMLDVMSPERIGEQFGEQVAKMYKPFYTLMAQSAEALPEVLKEQIRQDDLSDANAG